LIRSVLGVVAGYAAWTVVFLGSSAGIRRVLASVHDEAGFTSDVTALLVYLAVSVIASLLAGFTVARIAGAPKTRWVWITAATLIGTGIPVQLASWDALPMWYNLAFLALLVPMTWVGGRMGGAGAGGA